MAAMNHGRREKDRRYFFTTNSNPRGSKLKTTQPIFNTQDMKYLDVKMFCSWMSSLEISIPVALDVRTQKTRRPMRTAGFEMAGRGDR
jgi:hypothetical protein